MSNRSAIDLRPLVSVVIPTYNRANFISETIQSVLGQRYDNLEVIVIDDGSTDNTAKVVQKFASQIRYVQQQNAERGASRNHGMRLATGEFIAFLDSDDLWLPDKVERDVEFLLRHPDVGLVYTDAILIDEKGAELRVLRARGPSGAVTDALLFRNFISIGAHLLRTERAREIHGFRENRRLSGSEDWEMWVRLSLRNKFAYLPVATTKIRTHPENTMSNPEAMQRSMKFALQLLRMSDELTSRQKQMLDRMEANMALVNAINFCSQKRRAESMRQLWNAILLDPRIMTDPRTAYTMLRLAKSLIW